ncbi:MAG: hypothetical protein OEV66_01075 [Spirochaetia bacterium]|nr:hypothetical protein [Spirochaetia bacterium]
MDKAHLREEYGKKFRDFEKSPLKIDALVGIRQRIHVFFHRRIVKRIMAYSPMKTELPILDLIKDLNYDIYIPRIQGEQLIPVSLSTGEIDSISSMDFIIVPGLFITKEGIRLGRGGGYYDRLLSGYPRNKTVFIGFDWQIKNELSEDPWDKRVGFWITQNEDGACPENKQFTE